MIRWWRRKRYPPSKEPSPGRGLPGRVPLKAPLPGRDRPPRQGSCRRHPAEGARPPAAVSASGKIFFGSSGPSRARQSPNFDAIFAIETLGWQWVMHLHLYCSLVLSSQRVFQQQTELGQKA